MLRHSTGNAAARGGFTARPSPRTEYRYLLVLIPIHDDVEVGDGQGARPLIKRLRRMKDADLHFGWYPVAALGYGE